jgi:peptidoglycan hydrolase-like protein with peptidoglycan-binding domain
VADQAAPERARLARAFAPCQSPALDPRALASIVGNRAMASLARTAASPSRAPRLQLARAPLTSPRFVGEPALQACADNNGRLGVGARDSTVHQPVSKVQQALLDWGAKKGVAVDLGRSGPGGNGVDGVFGGKTAEAVKLFKREEHLGSEQFGDVGPGTMNRLNGLFPAPAPTPPPAPPAPPAPPPPATCSVPPNPDMSGPAFNPFTGTQNDAIARHPIDAFTVNSLAHEALAEAQRIAPSLPGGTDGLFLGPADAFRHSYWNCRMAKEIGAAEAEQFATGHENSGPSSIPFDNQMDLHDNAFGRSMSSAADCKAAALAALRAGQLRTVRGPAMSRATGLTSPVPVDCIGASNQPWP